MNQTFSFQRFSLLVAKHWAENKKRYLLSAVAIIGLLVMWFLFIMLTDGQYPMADGIQQVTYLFSVFGVGAFYASQYFKDLGSKSKASNYLLVPASSLEKLMCSLLYVVIFSFIAFTALFYLADFIMVSIANAVHPSYDKDHVATVANVFTSPGISGDANMNFYFLLAFFTIQAAFLLGSIYFEKFSFIKTAISIFVIALSIFFLMYFFIETVLPNGSYHKGFMRSYLVIVDGENDHLVQLPLWIGSVLKLLFMYAIAPLLWVVTYFRLKEKQL